MREGVKEKMVLTLSKRRHDFRQVRPLASPALSR
jgi:hypothetical protein